MADIFCIQEADLQAFISHRRLLPAFLTQVGSERNSTAGGRRLYALNSRAGIEALAAAHLIPLIDTPIPFPARLRWGQTAEDRLVAVVPEILPLHASPRVQQMLAEWSTTHGLPAVCVPGQGQQIEITDSDQLTVVVHGSPIAVGEVDTTRTWRSLRAGDQAFVGEPLPVPSETDRHHNPFPHTYRVGNTVYIRLDLSATSVGLSFFQNLLSHITPDLTHLTAERRQQIIRAQLRQLRTARMAYISARQHNPEQHARMYAQRYNGILQQARQEEGTIRTLQAQHVLMATADGSSAMASQLLEQFRHMEKVAAVAIDRGRLVVTTRDLVLTHPRSGTRHLMGAYRIAFPTPGSREMPVIQNLTRRMNGMDHHPHIRPRPCWGNMQQMLPPLLLQNEYVAATSILIAYLETCNPGDPWGDTYRTWPAEVPA